MMGISNWSTLVWGFWQWEDFTKWCSIGGNITWTSSHKEQYSKLRDCYSQTASWKGALIQIWKRSQRSISCQIQNMTLLLWFSGWCLFVTVAQFPVPECLISSEKGLIEKFAVGASMASEVLKNEEDFDESAFVVEDSVDMVKEDVLKVNSSAHGEWAVSTSQWFLKQLQAVRGEQGPTTSYSGPETIQAPILTVRLPFAWPPFDPRVTPSKFFSFHFKNNFLSPFWSDFPISSF